MTRRHAAVVLALLVALSTGCASTINQACEGCSELIRSGICEGATPCAPPDAALASLPVVDFKAMAKAGRSSAGRSSADSDSFSVVDPSGQVLARWWPEEQAQAIGIQPPPPPEWCATCDYDRKLGDLVVSSWVSLPTYITANEHYGGSAFEWLLQECPTCGPAYAGDFIQATRGGSWLQGYYLKQIVDCRSASRPCLGCREIPSGVRNRPSRMLWVMTVNPVVEALLRTARDRGELGTHPQSPGVPRECTPSAQKSLVGEPAFFEQPPDPSLYDLSGTSPLAVTSQRDAQ